MDSAVLMIVITDRSRGGEFAAWFQSQGAALVLSALGQGTAATVSGGKTPGRVFPRRKTGSSGCQNDGFAAHREVET